MTDQTLAKLLENLKAEMAGESFDAPPNADFFDLLDARMGNKIGMRVIAVRNIESNTNAETGEETKRVFLYGAGVYEGNQPSAIGRNPLIRLDTGEVVRGYECWWGAENDFREAYPDNVWEWIKVPIPANDKSQPTDMKDLF